VRSQRGSLSTIPLPEAILERIDMLGPHVRAWVALDPTGALKAAQAYETQARAGRILGPLHDGIPVAVKDVSHVARMVTTCRAGLFAHEHPASVQPDPDMRTGWTYSFARSPNE
jgi:aspartyl-tRNA(Asn)/glutamyl-tRNA(Gln) amidotransferase subunit A